jgi:endonuclease G
VAIALAGVSVSGCGLDRVLGDQPEQGERHTQSGQPDEPKHGRRRHPKDKDHGAPPATPTNGPEAPAGVASIHLALGTPHDGDDADDHLMIKPQYALSYNHTRNSANWVSWELNESYFGGTHRHKGKFIPDDSLPAGWYRVVHDDYTGSDYDRGHMVRSEERTRSREDNESTFLLTNVLPQRHDLNAGPWLRLEDYCQALAQGEHREMFIVAGGIYGARPPTIGHGVVVPEAFFKIVVVLDPGQGPLDVSASSRVIAVIMPNVTGILDQPWRQYRTSVGEIERRTGYHFLDRVPEAARHVMEARVDSGPG